MYAYSRRCTHIFSAKYFPSGLSLAQQYFLDYCPREDSGELRNSSESVVSKSYQHWASLFTFQETFSQGAELYSTNIWLIPQRDENRKAIAVLSNYGMEISAATFRSKSTFHFSSWAVGKSTFRSFRINGITVGNYYGRQTFPQIGDCQFYRVTAINQF